MAGVRALDRPAALDVIAAARREADLILAEAGAVEHVHRPLGIAAVPEDAHNSASVSCRHLTVSLHARSCKLSIGCHWA
jgi:hypothetical protein